MLVVSDTCMYISESFAAKSLTVVTSPTIAAKMARSLVSSDALIESDNEAFCSRVADTESEVAFVSDTATEYETPTSYESVVDTVSETVSLNVLYNVPETESTSELESTTLTGCTCALDSAVPDEKVSVTDETITDVPL